ncbi:MAG: tRNA 5-methoxyuridine(34)/uridine 5-oxyacetic acid(34) synthase CmoB [Campylobacter sp.]|uniref:tRNA 5-methoxyuridine(34)/uridine 5-oxyacetic acid(34) synthase CmoB n=1 Tax=Campylobacter sp. TaxID=205 RepID=UPI00362415C1
MSLEAARAAKARELAGKIYAPLMREVEELAAKFKDREFELKFDDIVEINANLNPVECEETLQTALNLRSWRKGPFKIDDILIDSEWRSFVKFNLLAPHMDLADKVVGDIGCNNGYYLFRMLPKRPKKLIGFDPGVMSFLQFKFIDAFARSDIEYELLGVEHLPHYGVKFDALFCLGVLYHRSDPVRTLKELKGALNAGGELFLDTMYLDMEGDFALSPKNTYSKIPNIYFVPTISALLNWCERANFKDAQILAVKPTDAHEQRKTEWILGQSLGDFLDPADPTRTVEGYPAPKRVYLKLSV